MRQTIKGLLAAFAVMTAGAAPAMACGFGGCSPCGGYSACGGATYAPAYSYQPAYTYAPYAPSYSYSYGGGCGSCGGGWAPERLAEPTTQYYYANQGPTYSGPGSFAPYPAYEESAVPSYGYGYGYGSGYGYHHYRPWHHSYHYGYARHHYAYRQHWGHEGYYWGHPLVRRYY